MLRIRTVAPLVLVLALAACRTTLDSSWRQAPDVPAPSFYSLGPARAPWNAAKCANLAAPADACGPLLAVAAQPSDADFAAAAAAGYRTVVNFRPPEEPGYVDEKAAVEAAGMRYVAIPLKGHGVEVAHADALAPILADASNGPVLMHCKSGTRARMTWAVWLARHGGMEPVAAAEWGRKSGLSGEPAEAVEKALGLR